MKPFSVVVTGEPTYLKRLINCISYGPDKLITHRYCVKDSDDTQDVQMNFGSLQVDEDHRIDFYGGNDEALFEFINNRPDEGFKGVIITLNADDSEALENFTDSLLIHLGYLQNHALVVGISGSDYNAIKQAEEQVRACMTDLDAVAPVFSIDPDSKSDVSLLVEALLCLSKPGISESDYGKSTFALSVEDE